MSTDVGIAGKWFRGRGGIKNQASRRRRHGGGGHFLPGEPAPHGLRDLDDRGEIEVFEGLPHCARRTWRRPFFAELWKHLVELPHLAVGSPSSGPGASV